MGIREPTDRAYEMIHDDTYRRMNLNSASLQVESSIPVRNSRLGTEAAYSFYFLSKNTPELPGARLTVGNGLSLGFGWSSPVGKRGSWYISLHDRLIFESRATDSGSVYRGNGVQLDSAAVRHPIINDVNTVAAKAGCSVFLTSISRTAGIYVRFLYGKPLRIR